jgi:hypothetical protein
LHEDHCALAGKLQRRNHQKSLVTIHLAVVQVHRVLRQPPTLQLHALNKNLSGSVPAGGAASAASSSAPASGACTLRAASSAASAFFSAARSSCQRPSAAVPKIPIQAASVINQKRTPRRSEKEALTR